MIPDSSNEISLRMLLDPIIAALGLRNVTVLAAELLPKSINVQAVFKTSFYRLEIHITVTVNL